MTNEEILKELNNNLSLKNIPHITEEQMDSLITYCLKNNLKEIAWRVAFTFSNVVKYSYDKLEDYYIKELDSFYLSELIYAVGDNNLNLKRLYQKVLDTKNEKFINEMREDLKSYFVESDDLAFEEIINNYDQY